MSNLKGHNSMRMRATAIAVVATGALVVPSTASASARSCQTIVDITHNRTETVLVVDTNTCNRLVWAYGVFNDPGGPALHSGVGVKSGQSVAYDPESMDNVMGGWKWNNNGPIHTVQTY